MVDLIISEEHIIHTVPYLLGHTMYVFAVGYVYDSYCLLKRRTINNHRYYYLYDASDFIDDDIESKIMALKISALIPRNYNS